MCIRDSDTPIEGDDVDTSLTPVVAEPSAPVEEPPSPLLEQPVAEVPQELTEGLPEAPAVPDPLEALRQQNLQQQRQIAEFQRKQQEQQEEQQLQQLETQERDHWEQQGVLPEQAARIAASNRQVRAQALKTVREGEAKSREVDAQRAVAGVFANQYKVPIEELQNLPTPQAMEEKAKALQGTSAMQQELATLRAEVKNLREAQVPAQTFASTQTESGGVLDGAALEEAVGNGLPMTPDIQARLQAYYKKQGFGG